MLHFLTSLREEYDEYMGLRGNLVMVSPRVMGALATAVGAVALIMAIVYAAYGLPAGRSGGTPIGNLVNEVLMGFMGSLFIVLGLVLLVKGPTLSSRR
jgi:1,4-dihydroxy-2-naphthoate octaprenyltransferase